VPFWPLLQWKDEKAMSKYMGTFDLMISTVPQAYQSRELATISALASMTGTEGQLRFHLGAAMNTGLTEVQMRDFISVLEAKVGKTEAASAQKILTEVLNNRK
jgi:alkylhydroperoxidase/carboxymuconolactone decarboxylase family protein YurZ